MIAIDGSSGEGGGQILRTSLALSLVTGQAFRMQNIRANRNKPGLQRQHLVAVQAATAIANAEVEGAALGSVELMFKPGKVTPGVYGFAIGTAGSATLVAQTVLPALMLASEKSVLTMEGGTHNPMAPPFDFLQKTFLPLVNRMGPNIVATLLQHGFYPSGGGKCNFEITPVAALSKLGLLERGEIKKVQACSVLAQLPAKIAERELKMVSQQLGRNDCFGYMEQVASTGPGNVLMIEVASTHVTEVFTGFGERGVRAEAVAQRAVDEALIYLDSVVPVGEHLADQLLIPLALAGGGGFKTFLLSQHALTNIETIQKFLEVKFTCETDGKACVVSVQGPRVKRSGGESEI